MEKQFHAEQLPIDGDGLPKTSHGFFPLLILLILHLNSLIFIQHACSQAKKFKIKNSLICHEPMLSKLRNLKGHSNRYIALEYF